MGLAAGFGLGVNVDHVATIRQARGTIYPDPVLAALEAERAGADLITVHLREDRRHIQEHDVKRLLAVLRVRLNLEMAATSAMVDLAVALRPQDCCLVPERRAELTTEGGLDVRSHESALTGIQRRLEQARIRTAFFVDPDPEMLRCVADLGGRVVELHTGAYAESTNQQEQAEQLRKLCRAAELAWTLGLEVHAGHGLHLDNVSPVAALAPITELNIGHAIVARALFVGMHQAVAEMKACCLAARHSIGDRGS